MSAHHEATVTGREMLDDIGAAVAAVRRLRYEPTAAFTDIDVDDLERARRGLQAVATDCRFGADLLARAIAERSTASTSPTQGETSP